MTADTPADVAAGSPFDVQAGSRDIGNILHGMAHATRWASSGGEMLLILMVGMIMILLVAITPVPSGPPT